MKIKVGFFMVFLGLFLYGIFNIKSNFSAYKKKPKDTVKMNLFLRSIFFIVGGLLFFIILLIKILKEVL